MFTRQSRWNLYLIAVVAILLIATIVFLGIRANNEVKDIVEQQFTSQQLLLNQQISKGIEEFLNEKVLLIEIISKQESQVPPDLFTSYFKTIYEESSGFFSIQFINENGTVVSGYPEDDLPIGYNLYENNQSWAFERVQKRQETYITGGVQMFEEELGSFTWVPLFHEGEFKGAILSIIKVSDVTERFLESYGSSGHVYLVDKYGMILYDSSNELQIGNQYSDLKNESNLQQIAILQEQINGTEGSGKYFEDGRGGERIVTYSPIGWRNQRWSVGITNPVSDVDSLINSVYVKQGVFIGISGIFILAGSMWVILLLSKWNKILEEEVASKTREIKQSNELLMSANVKLKELDLLKTEFVSIVSHELRTPLTAMKTSAEFLKEDNCDSSVRLEMLDLIIRNIDRQTRMVSDLLDISRIESGRIKFNPVITNLHEIVNLSVKNMDSLSEEKGISIHVDLPKDLPHVRTDKDKLIQVLVNLLNNAIKFTPQGGNVEISSAEFNDFIEIRVKDDGIGIAHDLLDNIFDKFYQIDSSTTRKIGGSGLGLAITKGIIEGQGGTIRVESMPDIGTTFMFTLGKQLH
ncbi:MAG TPA: sensor histidine kinase [Methanosarcinaceae archaeon]|nr:sensor histidine kinase [Methanosarcinaceae archaeon]